MSGTDNSPFYLSMNILHLNVFLFRQIVEVLWISILFNYHFATLPAAHDCDANTKISSNILINSIQLWESIISFFFDYAAD